jgi:hypothetical protein
VSGSNDLPYNRQRLPRLGREQRRAGEGGRYADVVKKDEKKAGEFKKDKAAAFQY